MTIISLFGLVINSLVIFVLINKQFEKEFKQKQYSYLIVYSTFNLLVCFIQILSLINECQQPFGLFCSSIRQSLFVQYTKLVFYEFFLHFFISMSNLTYVAFSLCRLSLIGSENNKFIQFISEFDPKKLILVFILFSTCLTLVKPFKYSIELTVNHDDYEQEDFPNLFYKYKTLTDLNLSMFKMRLILDVLYDFVNYCVFVLVNLVIDILLLNRVWQVMLDKEAKMSEQIREKQKKLKRENRESFRKLVKMVAWNLVCGVVLKIPNSVTSLNDFRLLVFNLNFDFFSRLNFQPNEFAFPYSMGYLCLLAKVCNVFHSFGHFLYLTSLTANFFFLKRFDKNFQKAFATIFSRSNKNEILN